MRGDDQICGGVFSYIDLEKRVRSDHPLRVIRQIALHANIACTPSGLVACRYREIDTRLRETFDDAIPVLPVDAQRPP